MPLTAEEDAVRDRNRRTNNGLGHVILGQQLEFVVGYARDKYGPILARRIELVSGDKRRGVKVRAMLGKSPLPNRLAGGGVDAHDLAAIADQNNATLVNCRSRYKCANIFSLPYMVCLRDVAASGESNPMKPGHSSIVAAVGDHRHLTHDHRRRDGGPQGVCIWIEVAAGPCNLPIGRTMDGQVLGAPNQDRLLPLVLHDERGCIAV